MRRLLVNDMLSALPDHRTFWHDLKEWFGMEFVGGDYSELAKIADEKAKYASLIVRNASWFGPMEASIGTPTISLLQDIFTDGPQREMQNRVIETSKVVVFNSDFTISKYSPAGLKIQDHGPGSFQFGSVIPLPVDFNVFQPGNPMGLQQALSLPDGCVCWIGASQGAAAQIKGWDVFLTLVRHNPDISFVGVFKDAKPEYGPPNLRMYERVDHQRLVEIIGACRVGLCTSRMESQHLAGIEMGGCGLPMVAPEVGVYWKRDDIPGTVLEKPTLPNLVSAIRAARQNPGDPEQIRQYWHKEFGRAIVREKWEKLIKEVERG